MTLNVTFERHHCYLLRLFVLQGFFGVFECLLFFARRLQLTRRMYRNSKSLPSYGRSVNMMAAQLYSQSMTVIISPPIAADEIIITPAVTAEVVLMYLFSFIRCCIVQTGLM